MRLKLLQFLFFLFQQRERLNFLLPDLCPSYPVLPLLKQRVVQTLSLLSLPLFEYLLLLLLSLNEILLQLVELGVHRLRLHLDVLEPNFGFSSKNFSLLEALVKRLCCCFVNFVQRLHFFCAASLAEVLLRGQKVGG